LKTAVRETVPGVRIPLPPPFLLFVCWLRAGDTELISKSHSMRRLRRYPGVHQSWRRSVTGGERHARALSARDFGVICLPLPRSCFRFGIESLV